MSADAVKRTNARGLLVALVLATAVYVGIGAEASGSVVTESMSGSTPTIKFQAPAGQNNNLEVAYSRTIWGHKQLVISDVFSSHTIGSSASADCGKWFNTIICKLSDDPSTINLEIHLGDKNDELEIDPTASDWEAKIQAFGDDNDDTIDTGDLDDTIDGGEGDDTLFGGGGADAIGGGSGDHDQVSYAKRDFGVTAAIDGAANDGILGEHDNIGSDVEYLIGSGHADVLVGDGDLNNIKGGGASDVILGGGGDDYLQGEGGTDAIYGDSGSDNLFGGDGNDNLYDTSGYEAFDGGAGNDRIHAADGVVDNAIECGDDSDTLYLDSAEASRARNCETTHS